MNTRSIDFNANRFPEYCLESNRLIPMYYRTDPSHSRALCLQTTFAQMFVIRRKHFQYMSNFFM